MFKILVLAAVAFLAWVIAEAWGFPAHVFVFTVGACAMWAGLAVWTLRQRTGGWHHDAWVLGLATAFWWLGEAIALRLGKYQYYAFPLTLPFSGTPGSSDVLTGFLESGFLPQWWKTPIDCMGAQMSWAIPFPVVAIEAALIFTMFRISVLFFKRDIRTALATGGLSAVLFINATALLDPVVSTTQWCGEAAMDPGLSGLQQFGLWHWFTNATHPGGWFGVPLVNYSSWFLAALTFGFWSRKDDERRGGFVQEYKAKPAYILAGLATLFRIFGTLIAAKVVVDWILIRAPQVLFGSQPVIEPRVWQLSVVVLLLALGVVLILRGRAYEKPEFRWVFWMPQLFVFAYCLGALLFEFHWGVFTVAVVTTGFLLIVVRKPGLITRTGPPAVTAAEPPLRV